MKTKIKEKIAKMLSIMAAIIFAAGVAIYMIATLWTAIKDSAIGMPTLLAEISAVCLISGILLGLSSSILSFAGRRK